jgi:hypothetical protein
LEGSRVRRPIREPAERWQPAQLRVDLDGTQILMHSGDVPADWLAELANTLVRAPSAPPTLSG